MRVTFERSGGFAGLILTKTIDSTTLSSSEIQALQRLIEAADFFRLPSVIGIGQPDRFQYQITVEDRDLKHSIQVNEASVPGTLQPLIEWLEHQN